MTDTELLNTNTCWHCNIELYKPMECLYLKYADIIAERKSKNPDNPYNKDIHEYYPCYLWCATQKRKQWNERMEKYKNPSYEEILERINGK